MTEMMKAIVATKGEPLIMADVAKPVCGPRDVIVSVEAAGLNRADLVQRAGKYPPPPGASEIMGLEIAGTVVEIGPDVGRWSVGDRVCALLAGGGYAEYAAVDKGSLLPIPEGMSFNEAAALPEVMLTVWANIFVRCGLKEGETLLVHGGTSGIGTMAIQMARHAGAGKIIVTAGSNEKCAAAMALGADIAINYKESDFEKIVKDEGGADVILDMVGGDYVQKNMSAAKLNGRICNIAYMNGPVATLNLLPIMLKRLILTGTTLRARAIDEKSKLRKAVEDRFWPAVAEGVIKPVIDTVYGFDQAEAAQAHLAKGGHIGKILLSRTVQNT
ncbi:MAG: NAD(P)H-quinone oxidoreductase [Pseudomonadota bacterium]